MSDIERAERARTGNYGNDCALNNDLICPICGKVCEYIILDREGFIVGCDECTSIKYEEG